MLTTKIKDIADAIREKTESNELFQLDDMPDAIRSISGGDETKLFTGSIDENGLKQLGYDDETIQEIKDYMIDWDADQDEDYIVSEFDLSLKDVTISNLTPYSKQIKFLPMYDTSSITNETYFSARFQNYNFSFFPKLDMRRYTDVGSMFQSCRYLRGIPKLEFDKVKRTVSMFAYCVNLKYIPYLELNSATTLESMFSNCISLKKIKINVPNATNMAGTFGTCSSIKRIEVLNSNKVTSFSSTFASCYALEYVKLETDSIQNAQQMFYGCYTIKEIDEIQGDNITRINSAFGMCYNLTFFKGIKNLGKAYLTSSSANYSAYTLDLSHCTLLTRESLISILNNLYDIKSKGCNNQKVTLGAENLAKLTEAEKQIAIDKGWNL